MKYILTQTDGYILGPFTTVEQEAIAVIPYAKGLQAEIVTLL
jgi:hypothetical protein